MDQSLFWSQVLMSSTSSQVLARVSTLPLAWSAVRPREWPSEGSVEAEQGSPGSGHAHRGMEKLRRR